MQSGTTDSAVPFLRIGVWRRRKDIFTNHELMNKLISHKAVYRTAPATPGLLKI